MITVAGEALIDILVDASGSVTALPGGGPFNVARTIARLGGDCQFLGRISDDAFGRRLRASLQADHVRLAVPAPTSAPTTLALAELDGSGAADYRFYLDRTAAAALTPDDVPPAVVGDSDAIALGGLGIVIEPIASTLRGLISAAPANATVVLDPNCRPGAIDDDDRYRAAIETFLDRVDIIKASVEDLAFLYPRLGLVASVRRLLERGPVAAIVTDGAAPVSVYATHGDRSIPVAQVDVVDTIGAGDAFVAGLLTWWTARSLSRRDAANIDALAEAAAVAVQCAAAACTTKGANLPDGFALESDYGVTVTATGTGRMLPGASTFSV
jgi:fructokinase